MRAPVRVQPHRFNELVAEFLKNECWEVGLDLVHKACVVTGMSLEHCHCTETTKSYACNHCNSGIIWVPVPMSLHDSTWGNCAGHGEVTWPIIPICPLCEPQHTQYYGCVHIGEVAGVLYIDHHGFRFEASPPPPPTFIQRVRARIGL